MPITVHLTVTITEEQLATISQQVAKELSIRQSENPMTVAQFAEAIGKSKGFVRKRVEAGIILKSDQPGEILIPHSELERYRNGGGPPTRS